MAVGMTQLGPNCVTPSYAKLGCRRNADLNRRLIDIVSAKPTVSPPQA